MAVGRHQELYGAGVGIAGFAAQLAGKAAQLGAHFAGQLGRRRRFLNQLLVAALDGTVPFVKMQRAAVLVGNQLHFNMRGPLQIAFVEQAGIGKGGLRRLARALNDGFQFRHIVDYVDADAAAAGGGLDHHRKAQFPGSGDGFVVAHGFLGAGHHRETGFAGDAAGGKLVAHLAQNFLAGADEHDAFGFATAGQFAVFGEKTVAGMNGLGAGRAGGVQYGVNVEIRIGGRRRADADAFVGQPGVPGVPVGVGIDGHGGHAQPAAGAHNADGDFAPVGN